MARGFPRWIARSAITLPLAAGLMAAAACGGGGDQAAAPQLVEQEIGFDDRAAVEERQSRVEAAIHDCMAAQGFEYVPVDPVAQRAAITGAGRLSEEDFLKQFGYGITTLFGRATVQSDPNEGIRAGLNDPDRAAYDRALFGENPGATFAQAIEDGDFTTLGGCTKQATDQVFGGADTLTTLQSKLDQLDEAIVGDQRMVRAIEDWATCMASAGYRYQDPEDVNADLTERLQQIVGPGTQPGATQPPRPGTTYDMAALQALQRDEVAVVAADLDCEGRFITPVEDVVRPQYEVSFREQNRALIGRLRSARG